MRLTRLKIILLIGLPALLTIISTGQQYVFAITQPSVESWRVSLVYAAIEWYSWAVIAPLIVKLCDKFPIDRQHFIHRIWIHFVCAPVFSFIQLTILTYGWQWLAPVQYKAISYSAMFVTMFSRKFHIGVLIYGAICGVIYAFQAYGKFRDETLKRSQLTEELTRAQLDLLKMQIDPHFLFNTLNTITAMIRTDPRAAELMITRLGDLLRLTLEKDGKLEVRLSEEMEFIDRYLEIEQTRFYDRLTIEKSLDKQLMNALIPNMILQPIVENAVHHGITQRIGAGIIRISAEHKNNQLRIAISDDGKGFPTESVKNGIGIANTRARLERMYGDKHHFEIRHPESGGAEVLISIPYKS